jgi:acetyl esterase/lipase
MQTLARPLPSVLLPRLTPVSQLALSHSQQTLQSSTTEISTYRQTPPTFLLQNEDDPVDPVEHSLVFYLALKKAGERSDVFPEPNFSFSYFPYTEHFICGSW